MEHNYVDIPAQPPALQELHWERQDIARRMGEAAIKLNEAAVEYHNIILEHIQINNQIRSAES